MPMLDVRVMVIVEVVKYVIYQMEMEHVLHHQHHVQIIMKVHPKMIHRHYII